jgi:arylsulfatase
MRRIVCVIVIALSMTAALQAAPRPNIVLILADDMGFSDAHCMGGEIDTPNLDRVAAEGVRFTQFYNTARCCPTRASLLTGLYPHQAGMGWMTGRTTEYPGYSGELSHDAVTIAEVLHGAGYATYMAGKWHVTSKESPAGPKDNWPRQRGFDRYYGTVKGGGSYFDPAMLTRDNTPITPQSDAEYKPEHFYYTDAIADQSARFIREHHERSPDKPFFLYTAFTSPHWPLHAPAETIAKYKGKYDAGYEAIRAARFERMKSLGVIDASWQLSPAPDEWSKQQHKEWEARCMEVFAAQVDRMDQGIGKIVDALQTSGLRENTLVLFLQDNGGCAEKMGRDEHKDRTTAPASQPMKPKQIQPVVFPRYTRDGRPIKDGLAVMPGGDDSFIAYGENWANISNTPFREYKHWTHEGGISTPLIANWPAGIARKNEIDRTPGHLIDVMATCVDLAGATYSSKIPMQGVSLAPVFAGKTVERKAPIFFEHESNRAVRDGKWKLVAKGQDGPWELYDMDADRSEMHDLAAAQPERVKQLAETWQKWAESSNVLPLGAWKGRGGGGGE